MAALAYDPATFPESSEIVFAAGTTTDPVKSLIRALTSRIRIDQVVSFAWKVLAPLAVLQLLGTILLKGFLS